MAEATEEQFKLSDGTELYMKKWHPAGTPVAKLVFVHGFSDHCNRYYDLFPTLASRGILVIGFDQRGFGRSAKKRSEVGVTGPTPKVLADVVQVIKSALPSPVPVFVMGHSMGGGEVLTLASTPEYAELTPQIRGWIGESPLIGLASKVNPITLLLGRFAGKFLPHMQLVQAVPPKNLSRDPEVVKSIAEDKMCDGTGSLETFANMLDRGAALESGKLKLNEGVQSLLLAHGSGDVVTSYPTSKKWLERQATVKDKTFLSYDGWYHQLHADLPETRTQFAKDVGDWILSKEGAESKGEHVEVAKQDPTPPAETAAEQQPAASSEAAPVEEQARL